MDIGLSFPIKEVGADPAAITDFVRRVEAGGFTHLTVLDHVVAAGKPEGTDFARHYSIDNMFHEPLTLMSYLAAVTKTIELATAILILPQRQTALVAKQAAQLDILCGGRLRLGVGLGWNAVEFEALGEDFHNRGARIEEQIVLLRRLWTERLVSFDGRWHKLNDVGLNPPPVQRPIPLWIGAMHRKAIARAGRLADGLFINPRARPDGEGATAISILRQAAAEADRNPDAVGIDATVFAEPGGVGQWLDEIEAWRGLGATRITFRTMERGLEFPDQHFAAMDALQTALA